MIKKILAAIIACIVIVISVLYISTQKMMQPSGKILAGTLSTGAENTGAVTFASGNFLVVWTGGDNAHLRIEHVKDPDRVLWSSIPGKSFVAAAKGNEKVIESRGLIVVKDKLEVECADQTVNSISQEEGVVIIRGKLQCTKDVTTDYSISFDALSIDQLGFEIEIENDELNRSYLTYGSEADERFFGFGEQFTHFDLKGHRVPILISEQGLGRGQQPFTFIMNLAAKSGGSSTTSYACVPHYITSKMKSLFLENYEYSVFDMRKPDKVQLKVYSPGMRGRIINGNSPSELIAEYTEFTGRMKQLPDWAHDGAILGLQGGTEKVRNVYRQLKELDAPVAALWLQDWEGQRVTPISKQLWWNWELDHERYPEWDALVADMRADGVRVLGYINPFLVDVADKPGHRRNMFNEAKENGYLVKDAQGEPYMIPNTTFSSGLIDISNPATREWIKNIIKDELIGVGLSGWMADFAEALPYDAYLHSGEPAADYHNKYAEEWARLNGEAVSEAGLSDDIVYFSRSGFSRSPGLTRLFWLGDQMVSWDKHDGIKSAVTGMLSSGLSGFSLNHSDIGGFTTIPNPFGFYQRDKELLMRWSELNAFTPVFRTHEGSFSDLNTQFYSDEETLAHFSRFAKIFKAWMFYRIELMKEAEKTGLPVARHLFIHYPDDPAVYDISYEQFMIGDEFIIAPVLDPGHEKVSAYLPAGCWTHLWSRQEFCNEKTGRSIEVSAPIGSPGVFYKSGSGIAAQFIENLEQAGVISN